MTEPVIIGDATLYNADCLDVLRGMADCSVDAVVTDPPAGISFMGKEWDHHKGGRGAWIAWMTEIATEVCRVLKPGGHALVWAIPRTSHWTATAWEDAGFDVKDRIAHCFGSGFPKSLDVSKALDKSAGAERDVVGKNNNYRNPKTDHHERWNNAVLNPDVTAPATEAARQWQGWGTALKPAIEDWWLMRKPLDGTVAANVLAHGTGAINIDGCRVETDSLRPCVISDRRAGNGVYLDGLQGSKRIEPTALGRWPANLIHSGEEEIVRMFPVANHKTGGPAKSSIGGNGAYSGGQSRVPQGFNDTGSAARFFKSCPIDDEDIEAARLFYCAKASKADRDSGLDEFERRETSLKYNGGEGFAGRTRIDGEWVNTDKSNRIKPRNHHPCVKPVALMKYLVRLITPPGGTVADFFMGSGSTGKAAMLEGFKFIGVEREPEYFEIACARIEAAQKGQQSLDLDPAA